MGQSNPDRHTDNMLFHFSCLVLLASSAFASPRPDDGYGAPEPVYEEPETGYGPPDDGYGAPAAGYGAPSYAAETGLDLTTLIIPLLALVGLFLLFPTYVTLTSVRRKREAGEEPAETKLVERLQDMYLAVIESEECVERIACEVGGIARDAGLDENLVTAASYMVPSKYSKYAKQFASSRKCEKIKCGSF